MKTIRFQGDPVSHTGLTVYAVIIRQSDGYFLNAALSFVASVPTFPAMAEDANVKGEYTLSIAAAFDDGGYTVRVMKQAGGAQSLVLDTLLGSDAMQVKDDVEVVAFPVGDVWDETIAGHLATGTTGKALSDSSSGDPWTKTVPGSYPPGSAGAILGALPTEVDSRLPTDPYGDTITEIDNTVTAIAGSGPVAEWE